MFLEGKTHFTSSFYIFEEFGVENCKIELIEQCPCENLEQLLKREGEFIRNNFCINKYIVGRSSDEIKAQKQKYREEHRETQKIYREEHRDELNEYSKKYREENKDELREKKKKYYEKHKQEKQKYYEENKEKISEKRKEKIECQMCKSLVRKSNITTHKKSKKCMVYQSNT
jgi:hypothetical protein